MERIVIGVDASETARRAAAEGVELAASVGATVHFVTAISKKTLGSDHGPEADHSITTVEVAESLLGDMASRYRESISEVTTSAVEGKPADVIVAEADRVGADLIIVGNRRMKGAGRFLGAIANNVAHHANCSVYIANSTG